MKAQFKRADRSGARYAVIIGDDEVAGRSVALKSLRTDEPQIEVAQDRLEAELQTRFAA